MRSGFMENRQQAVCLVVDEGGFAAAASSAEQRARGLCAGDVQVTSTARGLGTQGGHVPLARRVVHSVAVGSPYK